MMAWRGSFSVTFGWLSIGAFLALDSLLVVLILLVFLVFFFIVFGVHFRILIPGRRSQ